MDVQKLFGPYAITQIDPWLAPHAGDIELPFGDAKRPLAMIEAQTTIQGPLVIDLLTVA